MKRGEYKTDAVILNSIDFGESDKILTFYTADFGRINGIAKGALRSRKRFVGNLEPLSIIRLTFVHNGRSDLVRVHEITLIDSLPLLRGDIEGISKGSYMTELVREMTPEGHPVKGLFPLLLMFLKVIGENHGSYTLDTALRYFEVKLLRCLGYMPHLSGCVVCGSPLYSEGDRWSYFSSLKGGGVCTPCATGGLLGDTGDGGGPLISVQPGTASFLSAALRLDTLDLQRLKPSQVFLDESEYLLEDFIRHHTGKEMRSKEFIAKMKRAGAI